MKTETETAETFNILLTVPQELNDKLCAEAEKQKRSRQAQIVYLLEKSFEPEQNANGRKEKNNE